MAILIDTSILLRLANTSDVQHPDAARAVLELHRRGEKMGITPQVLIEFRNAATRPKSANGAGLSVAEAEEHSTLFEGQFSLIIETPDIFPSWKQLVTTLGIIGKQVHDARLVAICNVNGISHVLTFNVGHFNRMAAYGPGIVVIDPASI